MSDRNREKKRIALVVPDPTSGGGVASVARFLHEVIRESARYEAAFVSVPLSSRDAASVRLSVPRTWTRGVQVQRGTFEGAPCTHVGAIGVELEFQRYRPRRPLTDVLDGFDLVQVVAGTPAWALACRDATPPVALQVATLAAVERETRLADGGGLLGAWRQGMTQITARLDLRALAYVDAAFVENAWMQRRLQQRMDAGRVHFAPPGVDVETFAPADTDYAGTDAPILAVGRFDDPRKNARLLFRAYAHLQEHAPDAPRLLLAGRKGPPPDAWAWAERRGLRARITFREDVPQEELAALYRQASLHVVASDEEGLGLTILEAMASACPVVSTACGGPSTTVVEGETGFLTPVGDAEALAETMQRVLSDDAKAAAMGRAGRRRVEERFSRAAAGTRFLDVYDRLLGTTA